jgi:hypothetical protein
MNLMWITRKNRINFVKFVQTKSKASFTAEVRRVKIENRQGCFVCGKFYARAS